MIRLSTSFLLLAAISTLHCAPAPLSAAPPVQLLADINSVGNPSDSDADHFAELDGILYYQGNSPDTGPELWRTDGTEAGTAMVKDIYSGPDGSEPVNLVAHGNHVYFLARDETNSLRFWQSDGTQTGTVEPLANHSFSKNTNFYVSNSGNIFIEGVNSSNEHRLMYLNPDGGTSTLKVMREHGLSVRTRFFGDIGTYTYFTCDDSSIGRELWRTDGTAAGTQLVSDINPGIGHSEFRGSAVYNNELYFLRQDGLWRTNGTSAGTLHVKSITPITNAGQLVNAGTSLFFVAGEGLNSYRLWKSDGTPEGTREVSPNAGFRPHTLTVAGDVLYYIADIGGSDSMFGSPEVWKTDGTSAGTIPLTSFNTPGDTIPSRLTAVGNRLYFRSYDHGDLYTTDGTVAGTQLVKSFERIVSEEWNYEWPTASFGNKVVFTAEGGTGRDLWISDGTTEGTELVYEPIEAVGSHPEGLIHIDNRWYFSASDGVHGREPWVSDGTPAGTYMLKDIHPGSESSMYESLKFVPMGGKVYFSAIDGQAPSAIWETDGTTAGTNRVTNDKPGISSISMLSAGGKLFFPNYTDETGFEMWVSDGTDAGTSMIKDMLPHPQERPEILAAMNGEVYFFCSHFENSSSSIPQYYSLWKSNGTAAGTVVLYYFDGRDFFPSPGMEPLVANGYLYFLRRTFDSGLELWRTDGSPEGTPGGTIMLTDIGPGPEDTVIQYLTRLGNQVFFFAGGSLWKTDGSPAGTMEAVDMPANASGVQFLTNISGKLFYAVEYDSMKGLWQSDGTAAGTHRLHELPPVDELVGVGSDALYVADNGIHGEELWLTNSSGSRSEMVWDINPDSRSRPEQLIPGQEYVLFTANDGEHGRELWRLDISQMWPASADAWQLYE